MSFELLPVRGPAPALVPSPPEAVPVQGLALGRLLLAPGRVREAVGAVVAPPLGALKGEKRYLLLRGVPGKGGGLICIFASEKLGSLDGPGGSFQREKELSGQWVGRGGALVASGDLRRPFGVNRRGMDGEDFAFWSVLPAGLHFPYTFPEMQGSTSLFSIPSAPRSESRQKEVSPRMFFSVGEESPLNSIIPSPAAYANDKRETSFCRGKGT